jgi:hypothetical protein
VRIEGRRYGVLPEALVPCSVDHVGHALRELGSGLELGLG